VAAQVFVCVWFEKHCSRGLQERPDTVFCGKEDVDPRPQHRVGRADLGKIRLPVGASRASASSSTRFTRGQSSSVFIES
jgi:hypothetical protein